MIPLLEAECALSVARTGSLRRAAAEVHLSQPAVATHVNRLERRIGVAIFARTHSGTSITDGGREVLRHLESLVAIHASVERECRKIGTEKPPTLSIAGTRFGVGLLLPPALRTLCGIIDNLVVDTWFAYDDELLKLIRSGEVDMGTSFQLPWATTQYDDLVEEHLRTLSMRLAVSPSHRLAAQSSVRPADLSGETVINVRDPRAASFSKQFFAAVPDIKWITTDDAQTCLAMVDGGVGVTMSATLARPMAPALTYLPLDPAQDVDLTLVRRAHVELSPPAAILWDLLVGPGAVAREQPARGRDTSRSELR